MKIRPTCCILLLPVLILGCASPANLDVNDSAVDVPRQKLTDSLARTSLRRFCDVNNYKAQATKGWLYEYGFIYVHDAGILVFVDRDGLSEVSFVTGLPGWTEVGPKVHTRKEAESRIKRILGDMQFTPAHSASIFEGYRVLFTPIIRNEEPKATCVAYFTEDWHFYTFAQAGDSLGPKLPEDHHSPSPFKEEPSK